MLLFAPLWYVKSITNGLLRPSHLDAVRHEKFIKLGYVDFIRVVRRYFGAGGVLQRHRSFMIQSISSTAAPMANVD